MYLGKKEARRTIFIIFFTILSYSYSTAYGVGSLSKTKTDQDLKEEFISKAQELQEKLSLSQISKYSFVNEINELYKKYKEQLQEKREAEIARLKALGQTITSKDKIAEIEQKINFLNAQIQDEEWIPFERENSPVKIIPISRIASCSRKELGQFSPIIPTLEALNAKIQKERVSQYFSLTAEDLEKIASFIKNHREKYGIIQGSERLFHKKDTKLPNTLIRGKDGEFYIVSGTVFTRSGASKAPRFAISFDLNGNIIVKAAQPHHQAFNSEVKAMKDLKDQSHVVKILGSVDGYLGKAARDSNKQASYLQLKNTLLMPRYAKDGEKASEETMEQLADLQGHDISSMDDFQRLIKIFYGAAAGLDEMDKKGYIQRDVKPGNIFTKPDGSAVLADLGLTIRKQDANTAPTAGTPAFVDPRLMTDDSEKHNPKSDIWSLGIMGDIALSKDGETLNDILINVDPQLAFLIQLGMISPFQILSQLQQSDLKDKVIDETVYNHPEDKMKKLDPAVQNLYAQEIQSLYDLIYKKMLVSDLDKRISALEARKELGKILNSAYAKRKKLYKGTHTKKGPTTKAQVAATASHS